MRCRTWFKENDEGDHSKEDLEADRDNNALVSFLAERTDKDGGTVERKDKGQVDEVESLGEYLKVHSRVIQSFRGSAASDPLKLSRSSSSMNSDEGWTLSSNTISQASVDNWSPRDIFCGPEQRQRKQVYHQGKATGEPTS